MKLLNLEIINKVQVNKNKTFTIQSTQSVGMRESSLYNTKHPIGWDERVISVQYKAPNRLGCESHLCTIQSTQSVGMRESSLYNTKHPIGWDKRVISVQYKAPNRLG